MRYYYVILLSLIGLYSYGQSQSHGDNQLEFQPKNQLQLELGGAGGLWTLGYSRMVIDSKFDLYISIALGFRRLRNPDLEFSPEYSLPFILIVSHSIAPKWTPELGFGISVSHTNTILAPNFEPSSEVVYSTNARLGVNYNLNSMWMINLAYTPV
ncbi:MAG: hypothetical protein ACI959_002051, partial [Limisphaerales bacterium]